MDVSFDDFLERLFKPYYALVKLTCPGSIDAQNQVFHAAWLAFLRSAALAEDGLVLNRAKQFAADMLVSCKSQIENYNRNLIQTDNTGCSSVLEKWPTLSETFVSRLSNWLVEDISQRIGLAVEYSLDIDREVVDHAMGWGNHREDILKKAKAEFAKKCKFFQEHTRDEALPHHLLCALLDEDLDVPSDEERAIVKTDIEYLHTLA